MLVRAIAYRNERLDSLVEKALSGGTGGILHITNEICKT
jgi:hypothetical protein